jgi:hypothetical protein
MRLMHSLALVTTALLLVAPGAAAEGPVTEVDQAYVACMPDAAETADSLEHGFGHCSRPAAVPLRDSDDLAR